MGSELDYLPSICHAMLAQFGQQIQFRKVSELESENQIFVQDGNHGEYRPLPHEFVENGIPFVRPPNLKAGRIDLTKCQTINQTAFDRVRKGKGKGGDIVLTHNATIGRVAITAEADPKFVTNPQTTVWRSLDHRVIDPKFLYFFMCSSGFQDQLRAHTGRNATFDYVSLTKQRSLFVPILKIAIQKSIAHILGTLDDKIELNRRMNETLESMARALFKSWFVDFDPVIDNALAAGNPIPEPFQARAETRRALGSQRKPLPENTQKLFPDAFVFDEELGWIPEGWSITTFGEVSECFDRKRVPLSKKQREDKKPGVIPYHGATSVMDYINEWIFDDVFLLIGEDGSVIQEDGTPFIQYIWGKTWVNNHAHVLQGKDGVSTEHLLQFMACQNMTAYVTGAVQPKINQRNMNSIPFILASDKVNHNFGGMLSPIYSRYKQLIEQQNTLTKLRDTLLPKLLSGELRVPEAMAVAEEALS